MTAREYNQCVDDHADALYRFILKNIRDGDSARDIVQDAFERLWMRSRGISPEKAKSYLFTTAYHALVDHIRREKRMTAYESLPEPEPQDPITYTGLMELLDMALGRLPHIQRTVVLLRDYEGYSYEEIGRITGLNESQVKVYIFRARMFLKNFIGKPEQVI
jgi:RNA polymerase sigma-70 factor (ECF subfamily)